MTVVVTVVVYVAVSVAVVFPQRANHRKAAWVAHLAHS